MGTRAGVSFVRGGKAKIIRYGDLVKDGKNVRIMNDALLEFKLNPSTKRYIRACMLNDIERSQIKETYLFIIDMFISKGFSEKDALEYIDNKNKILTLSKESLVSKLAILSKINLDFEVLFSNNDILYNDINYKTLDTIVSKHINEKYSIESISEELSHSENKELSNAFISKLNLLCKKYLANIEMIKEKNKSLILK